jgi:hypothetical protein
MDKTFVAKSGHTLFCQAVKFDELPEMVKKFEYIEGNRSYHIVKNWDKDGVKFMYVAKSTKGEWLVWYRNGGFWTSYGKTMEDAINGAQADGWMYA